MVYLVQYKMAWGGKTKFLWQFCEGHQDKNQTCMYSLGVWFGGLVYFNC